MNHSAVHSSAHYGGVCCAPLYIFCGKRLLAAKLRPANVDPAQGNWKNCQRVIGHISSRWPQNLDSGAGDGACNREDIAGRVAGPQRRDYVFGCSKQ